MALQLEGGPAVAKDLEISFLLDFYGDMLTEKQREVIEFYYNEDLSLSEIADNEASRARECAIPLTRRSAAARYGTAPRFGKAVSRDAQRLEQIARRPSASRITTSTMCIPAIFPRIHRRL